jgi:hypothetical protein
MANLLLLDDLFAGPCYCYITLLRVNILYAFEVFPVTYNTLIDKKHPISLGVN